MRQARLQPCARCGQPIDYAAPPGDPRSFQVGHRLSWRDHPDERLDPANLQPEHELCNKQAGATDAGPSLGLMSRRW
ncbi:HNH endonuclease [Actinomyces bovis]|uniref:HNH endonuclease n=1 Tax=Actinomyces bovis TaxID=1658 RepID=UPI0038996BC9